MSTMTDDRDESTEAPAPRHGTDIISLTRCARCNLSYLPTKSTSALRLTYCSFLCELGDLGFSMAGLEHMERRQKPQESPPEPVAVE